jgi:high-affinity iron transporter
VLILAKSRVVVAIALALFGACLVSGLPVFAASSPQDDVRQANVLVQQALGAARSGDLDTARQAYAQYENIWFDIEDGVRAASRDSYVGIEKAMSAVSAAFTVSPPDQTQVVDSLAALDAEQQRFLGAARSGASSPTSQKATVATLLDELSGAQTALARNDFASATASLNAFQSTWLDVEGDIKTRSADDYRQSETDMQLATTLASQNSPQAAAVVNRMAARLEPYREAQSYGVFDAAIILLREGLEALLVIAALSAVLKKSSASAGQAWLWLGALGGLALSVVLGFSIQAFFGTIINPANRELMEGVIGLFAAGMLIYVSYWLHSKASISGWQSYINSQTRDALKGGRLLGIAILAFLAVFREGAETALFYLGMVGNISNSNLLLGLAIGFGGLVVLGFLLVVVGLRIPMRPFFAIASVLVFYLCFKFIGTGIHALQVSGFVSSTSATYLPSFDAVGLYPTWTTTIAQLVLLVLAGWVLLRDKVSRPARIAGVAGVGALVLGTAFVSASRPAVISESTSAVVPPAPVLTTTRTESRSVAIPRLRLEQAAAAVQNHDVAAARKAMGGYDAEWNGIEVYVNFRSRDLYGEIETHYEADINSALTAPDPDPAQVLPMLQGMLGKYDEAIRLSDTGAPLSPIFDDLAAVRTARAPLRSVGPALQSGDTAAASAAFTDFKARWATAQPLFVRYAPEALTQTNAALEQASEAMAAPGVDAAPQIDALLTSYNAGVNVLNNTARTAGYQAQ